MINNLISTRMLRKWLNEKFIRRSIKIRKFPRKKSVMIII